MCCSQNIADTVFYSQKPFLYDGICHFITLFHCYIKRQLLQEDILIQQIIRLTVSNDHIAKHCITPFLHKILYDTFVLCIFFWKQDICRFLLICPIRIEGKGNSLIKQGKPRHSRAVDFHPFQLLTSIERIGMQHTVIMKAVLQTDKGKLLTFGKCQLIYFAYLLRTGQVCDIAVTEGVLSERNRPCCDRALQTGIGKYIIINILQTRQSLPIQRIGTLRAEHRLRIKLKCFFR